MIALGPAAPAAAGFEEGKQAAMRGDYAAAHREWLPLAEQGHADAQFLLGLMYREGRAVPQDLARSAVWLEKAALQGQVDARYFLARALRDGLGVARDHGAAAGWFARAAEQGHAGAAFTRGLMHRKGEGGPKDDAEAARWYRKAADLGHGEARFTLGAVTEEGRGVAQDLVEAHAWYSLAEESGVELGGVLRDRLARRMTPEQVSAARRRADAYREGREPVAEEAVAAAPAAPAAPVEEAVAEAPTAPAQEAAVATPPEPEEEAVAGASAEEAAVAARSEPVTEDEQVARGEPAAAPEVAQEPAAAPEVAQEPAAAPEVAQEPAVAAVEREADRADAVSGAYRVQLAAYRTPGEPLRGWEILLKRHADLLERLRPKVKKVDLGPEKGVYFRLEAGPLADRAAAVALCAALEERDVECFVVAP